MIDPRPAVSHQRSEPAKPARRSYRRVTILLALVAAGVGFWMLRTAVLQWAITQGLQQTSLIQPRFSGVRLDFQRAELAMLQFSLQTSHGLLTAELEDVAADYDLRNVRINSLKMARARLRFVYQPAATATGQPAGAAVPIPQLSVGQLELEVDTPWGVSRFAGGFEADVQQAKPLLIMLTDAEQTIELEISPDFNRASLAVRHGTDILDLRLDQQAQTRLQGSINAELAGFLQWLKSTGFIPAQLRETIVSATAIEGPPNLAGIQLNMSVNANDNLANLKGRIQLSRAQAYLASAEWAANTAKPQLAIDGHVDLALGELMALSKPWLPETLNTWQFPAGNVMGTLRVNWQPKRPLTGQIYLNGHRLGVSAGPLTVDDGFIRLAVKDIAAGAVELEVDAPNLQLGQETTLHNLQLKAGLKGSTLSLERFTLPAFGGQLAVMPDTVDIDQQPLQFSLEVENLDLAQLLDSLNYPQLSGTGTISGKLPLRLALNSIEIKDGKLQGTRPGVLRYQTPITEGENLAFSALRNLQYHKLQAKLNYQADGHYQVGLRLQGKNPQVLSGHAVAFNLNLSGHLPDLLQKGLLAGDFDKPILEQIKAAGQQ